MFAASGVCTCYPQESTRVGSGSVQVYARLFGVNEKLSRSTFFIKPFVVSDSIRIFAIYIATMSFKTHATVCSLSAGRRYYLNGK